MKGEIMTEVAAALEHEVKQVISAVTGRGLEELGADKNFWTDLGIDSIKAIEMTVAMERKFKVTIRDEQIPLIATVGQAVEAVRTGLSKKS